MQNRYFGDVGDYGKYGLLRALSGVYPSSDPLRLGIVWYLTDDESHNNDGKHIGYLAKQDFARCDPHLFESLRSVADLPREVHHIPAMKVFPEDTVLFDDVLSLRDMPPPARPAHRQLWFERALGATSDCDLVFCDPDNGLAESRSTLHGGSGGKFTSLDEAAAFYLRGQSVVVYHHADRTASVEQQAIRRAGQLREATGSPDVFCLRYRRGTTRLFLVAPRSSDAPALRERAENLVRSHWGAHFEIAQL